MLLANDTATQRLGQAIAAALTASRRGLVMTLEGELGVGKTTLARATIRALGHVGVVPSPTYTLLETYAVADRHLHHLDLYRLSDPEELEFLGLRDLDAASDWFMIEWPDRGAGFLPTADACIELSYAGQARSADLHALTADGRVFVDNIKNQDS